MTFIDDMKNQARPLPAKAGRVEDPRVYLAAERTFLAWVRTSLALMGFGFLIARFALLIRETGVMVPLPEHTHRTSISPWLGFTMICFGVAVCLVSALRYRSYIRAGKRYGQPDPDHKHAPYHRSSSVARWPGYGRSYSYSLAQSGLLGMSALMTGPLPHVVTLGAGFGGLNAVQALKRASVRITVIDRANHHLFQPLLYQVATAALSPADISAPIRRILRRQKNVEVLLAEATAIDLPARRVVLADGEIAYDFLIVATGATHAYFGHADWEQLRPGLKSLKDALHIRQRLLMAFEIAEREPDLRIRQEWMTFVIVGAGPTGVELAGTLAEVARQTLARDFRHIDTAQRAWFWSRRPRKCWGRSTTRSPPRLRTS